MQYRGSAEQAHEYHCADEDGHCPHAAICPHARMIPHDTGVFQRIPAGCAQHQRALDIRHNAERPFNLLKRREGLEQARVRSQHSLLARCTIASIATLLIELAGTRKKPPKKTRTSTEHAPQPRSAAG